MYGPHFMVHLVLTSLDPSGGDLWHRLCAGPPSAPGPRGNLRGLDEAKPKARGPQASELTPPA